MFLFKRACFETEQQLYESIAADCPLVSNGLAVQCVPKPSGVRVKMTDVSTGITDAQLIQPPLIPCDIQVLDIVELSWLVVSVWVAAFVIKVIYTKLTK